MMIDVALPALLLVLLALAWHSALAARESARHHARELCVRAHLQLLDETVALDRLRPRRLASGRWAIERRYHFDVSSDGRDRHSAELHLRGDTLTGYHLPELNAEPAAIRVVAQLPTQP